MPGPAPGRACTANGDHLLMSAHCPCYATGRTTESVTNRAQLGTYGDCDERDNRQRLGSPW